MGRIDEHIDLDKLYQESLGDFEPELPKEHFVKIKRHFPKKSFWSFGFSSLNFFSVITILTVFTIGVFTGRYVGQKTEVDQKPNGANIDKPRYIYDTMFVFDTVEEQLYVDEYLLESLRDSLRILKMELISKKDILIKSKIDEFTTENTNEKNLNPLEQFISEYNFHIQAENDTIIYQENNNTEEKLPEIVRKELYVYDTVYVIKKRIRKKR